MSKINQKSITAKWGTLSSGMKAVAVVAVSIVVLGGISVPAYYTHQNRQALILAEQQEQERLAAEQAEAELIPVEEQARLKKEARIEADRIAAEEQAARQEMERVEQERAEKEEYAQLEAESQAEAGRIAAEEAAASEQTRPQPASNEDANSNTPSAPSIDGDSTNEPSSSTEGDNKPGTMKEPTSGKGREQADRMGGVWVPEMEGWVFVDEIGDYVYIYKNGGSSVLAGDEITIAKRYLK